MSTQKPHGFAAEANHNPFLRSFEPSNPFIPVPSCPAATADACETAVPAVEIRIRWGVTVLHVAQLSPPRSFFVGEEQVPGRDRSDFFLPEEKLGVRRLPIVLVREDGAVQLVIPAGAGGTVSLGPSASMNLRAIGGEPCTELAGARQIALPAGSHAALEVGGISFEVSIGYAGKKPSRWAVSGEVLPYTGLSLLLHVSLLASTALFMPTMAMADEDHLTEEQTYALIQALASEALKESEEKPDEKAVDTPPRGNSEAVGPTNAGARGGAGNPLSRHPGGRFGLESKGPEPLVSRAEALRQAQTFGMIELLQGLEGAAGASTTVWGQELVGGMDARSAQGTLWGDTIEDAAGSGGLHLLGIGEGSGRNGEGIGVGTIGTVGHDAVGGSGHAWARVGGGHQVRAPGMMRVGQTITKGRLPPEAIQRVVRQNFGRLKACYENGLRSNPSLQGRVSVRFVIGHEGEVSNAASGGSDLPDPVVVSCVTRAFYGLSFPHPEEGIVTVTYPILFSPAN